MTKITRTTITGSDDPVVPHVSIKTYDGVYGSELSDLLAEKLADLDVSEFDTVADYLEPLIAVFEEFESAGLLALDLLSSLKFVASQHK